MIAPKYLGMNVILILDSEVETPALRIVWPESGGAPLFSFG